MKLNDFADNLQKVQTRITTACLRAQRIPNTVQLIAVSKQQPAEAIEMVYQCGQRIFGESYIQEAIEKQIQLNKLAIEWHFIGRIQTNKTRHIATHFAWIHGLTDPAHAQRLNAQRPSELPPLNVCLQVNVSGEHSKAGIEPAAIPELLTQCAALPRLQIRGLMALPAIANQEIIQRQSFATVRQLRERYSTTNCPLDCLSMGMSDDLEAAILEGATLVRIGTAIFGARL